MSEKRRIAIIGGSEDGKTFLAGGISRGWWLRDRFRSLVADPFPWENNWGPQAKVLSNFEQWRTVVAGIKPAQRIAAIWDEGTEGGRFHSRTLCVPSDSSGLTIGRGYDMKERKPASIAADLVAAGVPAADAAKISQAAHLSGAAAKKFIVDNQLASFEISKAAQVALFMTTYNALKADVARICAKPDVVATFGACDLTKTDPENESNPDWSPDGRMLAVGEMTGDNRRIQILQAPSFAEIATAEAR